MPFYNKENLRNISEKKVFSETQKVINESKEYTTFDIFLSHCFLDQEVIKGLFLDLTSKGFKVYVDWIIDPHLDRTNVTKESAELIRNRMNQSRSLLLAISVGASTSKWIPWELGYVDGKTGKCAIIPVFDSADNNPESYVGFEYLKLYPYIKKANDSKGESIIWIAEGSTTFVAFHEFLNLNRKPFLRDDRL